MFHKIAFISTGLAAAICAPLQAQSTDQWTVDQIIFGTGKYDFASSDVQAVGDVDGDGYDDILIGSELTPDPNLQYGSVMVYSGQTHQLLYRKDGKNLFENQGSAVLGLGDVDGDGHADFMSGSPSIGRVRMYSGATGTRIYRIDQPGSATFGYSLAELPDWDGDGVSDFAAGHFMKHWPMLNAFGGIEIYSGATGAWLGEITPPVHSTYLGRNLESCGDLDGDGQDDLLATFTLHGDEMVVAYSGATAAELWRRPLHDTLNTLYMELSRCGDLDHDGTQDFIASGPYAEIDGVPQAGALYVYSGAHGSLITERLGITPYQQLGAAIVGDVDLNGDGWLDVVTSVTGGSVNPSSIHCHSGRTGYSLGYYFGWNSRNQLGESMGSVGDTDGDGITDIVLTAPYTQDPMTGEYVGALYLAKRR
jgi:hypothetical protein